MDLRDRLGAALEKYPSATAMSVGGESADTSFFFTVGDAGPCVRFQAASISKVVAAEIVLSLVVDRAIGLDDDIFGHVPDLRPKVGAAWEPMVTIRMVLSHTAGFVDDSGFPGYPVDGDLPSLHELL